MSGTAPTSTNQLLEAALTYARRGWRVLPLHTPIWKSPTIVAQYKDDPPGPYCSCGKTSCGAIGKHPRTGHGVKDATVNETQIRQWWKQWPNANVGIATGEESGIVVLDIDPRNGGKDSDLPGVNTLHALWCASGGGGTHIYIKARTAFPKKPNFPSPGIDFQADKAYVIAPPSLHVSGERYLWYGQHEQLPEEDNPQTPSEHIWQQWVTQYSSPRSPLSAAPPPSDPGSDDVVMWMHEESVGTGRDAARVQVERALAKADADGWNNAGFGLATQLRDLGLPIEEARAYMTDYQRSLASRDEMKRSGRSEGYTWEAARKSLESAYNGERREPPQRPTSAYTVDPASIRPLTDKYGQLNELGKSHLAALRTSGQGGGAGSEGGEGEVDEIDASIPLTDYGNAQRFVAAVTGTMIYCPEWGSWLYWDGRRWKKDDTGEALRQGQKVARAFLRWAEKKVNAATKALALDKDNVEAKEALKGAKKTLDHAKQWERTRSLGAMLDQAQVFSQVVVKASELDTHTDLLCCPNGVVDLRTGVLRPHDPALKMTKLTEAEYDEELVFRVLARGEGADFAEWGPFVQYALADQADPESGDLREFVQRAGGYAITGETSEEVMFFVHGFSRTGKSTFVSAFKGALGNEYTTTADIETFLAKGGGTVRPDIARLAGDLRAVFSIEVAEGEKLAQGVIKQVTGRDMMTARHLYQSAFEFLPHFKLFLIANDPPIAPYTDTAFWNRMRTIPWNNVVTVEDHGLKHRLTHDPVNRRAVLAWLVLGAIAWYKQGLGLPKAVSEATALYRDEQNPLAAFVAECCDLGPDYECSVNDLRDAYQFWADENRIRRPIHPNNFGRVLTTMLKLAPAMRDGSREWVRKGIKVKE